MIVAGLTVSINGPAPILSIIIDKTWYLRYVSHRTPSLFVVHFRAYERKCTTANLRKYGVYPAQNLVHEIGTFANGYCHGAEVFLWIVVNLF